MSVVDKHSQTRTSGHGRRATLARLWLTGLLYFTLSVHRTSNYTYFNLKQLNNMGRLAEMQRKLLEVRYPLPG